VKRLVCVGLLVVTGCSASRLPPPPATHGVPVWTEVTPVEETSLPEVTPPGEGVLIPVDSPAVPHAGQAAVKAGTAPTLNKKSSGCLPSPFGLSQPTVDGQPLPRCAVARELGEDRIDLAAGHRERGSLHSLGSWPPGTRTRPVRLTPTDDTRDLATALVRGTDRRGSRIRLGSQRTGDLVTVRFSGRD